VGLVAGAGSGRGASAAPLAAGAVALLAGAVAMPVAGAVALLAGDGWSGRRDGSAIRWARPVSGAV